MALLDEGATTCCYARSEKHWITDPRAWRGRHFSRSKTFLCSMKRQRCRKAPAAPQSNRCTSGHHTGRVLRPVQILFFPVLLT